MFQCSFRATLLSVALVAAAAAADKPPRHPTAPPAPADFYTRSGFAGREAELGAAAAEAIRKAGPAKGEAWDFSPAQQQMLGVALARAIQTIKVEEPYQHEMNDAVVKAQLTALQFAKDNNMVEAMVNHEVKTQTPMMIRVGKLLAQGGNPELGLIAITERTACFYQLVTDYSRDGLMIRWKSPYGTVLSVGSTIGQFNMTEKEVHEIYTVPAMTKRAAVMGMEVSFAPWQDDGWITMTARMPKKVAAN
jgi:hypothetical protein